MLPRGQHQWSARAGGQTIKDRYSATGGIQTLGALQTRNWSWGELLSTQHNKSVRDELVQYMKQNDISDSDVAGTSGFEIERDEANFDLSWAYGMTDRWMFGLFIPVSHVTTKVESSIQISESKSQGYRLFSQQGNNVEKMVEEVVRRQIEDQGYRDVPAERTQWVWGDISLMNQYLFYQSEDVRSSLQQTLRMPTSRNPSLSDFALASRDEGQVDVGITSFTERNFGPTVGVLGLGYINQLPGPVRVSEYDQFGNKLPDDREVERDLGDVYWGGLESRWEITSRFKVSGAYRYFYKDSDQWKSFANPRDSHQEAHVARMMTSYVFSPGESRFEIEKKWLMSFQVQSTLAGVNMDRATSATLELQTYF